MSHPEDRAEHVRLIMDLMGVDEAKASFIVSIERGESSGDVFIAGGTGDRAARSRTVDEDAVPELARRA